MLKEVENRVRWDRVIKAAVVVAAVIALAVIVSWLAGRIPAWQVPTGGRGSDLPDFGPLLTVLGFYFIPTIVALARRHINTVAIGALNLLLGWTILGWIGALIWALLNQRRDAPVGRP
ncbi:MAG: superinfection immunity protein [Caulobacter sp.]|nr:superinfection immunity protein [Caulobacter sp.]